MFNTKLKAGQSSVAGVYECVLMCWSGKKFYFWFSSRVLLENSRFALGLRVWRDVSL